MTIRLIARSLDLVLRDIVADDIAPHFQPIVDLSGTTVIGYEVLSRGPSPFESPSLLFARARQLGLTEELERACHTAAFARIGDLNAGAPGHSWFVNVSPEVFCVADSVATAAQVRAYGLEPSQIVFELTERDASVDHQSLRRAARLHADAGFRIALDDFGSGSSGLLKLVSCEPDVVKLDMELTHEVNAHPYKQSVVRSMVSLAASLDAQLIAEGVETRLQLDMLFRLGVRFAQGRLFAEPVPEPRGLARDVTQYLRLTSGGPAPVLTSVEIKSFWG